ncbi:MAG: NTP transferase domain-containing protein, partial [Ilumatobacteraceae bacterium]|nr:NTP transferase domain-containing protein [Ilumatobacteraceae bacterium]
MMRRRGYVLAGGSSRRMGVDKAFLPVSSQSAVERQCQLLQEICPDGVFIVGRNK